jgi:small redox-active disulfide protein 2
MDVKILGSGCMRCDELEKRTRNALAELDVAADLQKVKDLKEITSYGVFSTPALVVNGKTLVSGRLPSVEELKELIQKNL